jgi:hypothetical protein
MEYFCSEKRIMAGVLKHGNKSSFSVKYGEYEKPRVYYIFKSSSAA